MSEVVKLTRRQFVALWPGATAGFALGVYVAGLPRAVFAAAAPDAFIPNLFVRLDSTGAATIMLPMSEMGQGVMTSLPMALAEELDVDWQRVRVEQAGLDSRYGMQIAGGSQSHRHFFEKMRKAGAAARAMLVAAAAQQWGVEPAACRTEPSVVVHEPTGRRLPYADLVVEAARLRPPNDPPLKNPDAFRLIGKTVPRVDTPSKVNGTAVYGMDLRVPGMLYAVVARCPYVDGELGTVDASKAKALPGVRQIVEMPRTELGRGLGNSSRGGVGNTNYLPAGVAVLADSTWAAMKGRRALVLTWKEGPNGGFSSEAIRERLRAGAETPQRVLRNDGDVDAALAAAAKRVEATYEVPFQAHAPMEPVNCTAHVTSHGCELWAPTQYPIAAVGNVALALGIPVEKVHIHVPLLGGGFGRRLNNDYASEAALLSKAAGAPVKVVWSREDDLQHDYYRPSSCHKFAAGLDASGKLTAWVHNLASTPLLYCFDGPQWPNPQTYDIKPNDYPANMIPNMRRGYSPTFAPIRLAYYRSVEASANAFVIESFVDELAAAAGVDPVQFRLSVLGQPRKLPFNENDSYYGTNYMDTGRLRTVIELAAEKAGWGQASPAGQGRGIAAYMSFASFVAHVAEVSVAPTGAVRVHRIVTAIDCGTVVNPGGVKAQVESAIVFALSAALKDEITFKGGRVEQSNFNNYQMLRIGEMPRVEVHIVPSHEPISGVGEPPVGPVAPAVANAIFAATGKRIRRLPIRISDLASPSTAG